MPRAEPDPDARTSGVPGERGSALPPLRGLALAAALAWIAVATALYLAARELGLAIVP